MTTAVVALKIDEFWIGLDASLVLEVLGESPWVPLAGVAAAVPGVLAWRGRAIAVVDLANAAGLGSASSPTRRRRALVVKFGGDTLALPVDDVREVQLIDAESVQSSHATRLRYSSSEVDINGLTLPLLDSSALMASLIRPGA